MFEKLKEMNEELNQLRSKHLEQSKVMFQEIANQLFEKHSVLESFGWVQYTPYFNDGDECIFSVRNEDPDINGYDYYEDALYDKLLDYDGSPRKNFDSAINAAYEDVHEFLSNIEEDVLQRLVW